MTDELEPDDPLERIRQLTVDGLTLREKRLTSIASEIADWASRQWTYESAPNLVIYSIIELAYSYPKRAHDLILSMRSLVCSNHLVPAVILARALVETVAMGRYFIEQMEKNLTARNFEKIESQFFRFYAGSKLPNAPIKSVHVNDALRDLEDAELRYLSYLVEKYPSVWGTLGSDPVQTFRDKSSLRQTYDKLSEISHPNGLGTQYLYPATDAPDNSEIVGYYRQMTDVAIWQGHHLLTALARMDTFTDRFMLTFPDRQRFSDEHSLQTNKI